MSNEKSGIRKYLSIIFAGLMTAVLFASCEPIEGSIKEVKEKAEKGATYTVKFDINGGSGDAPPPITVRKDSSIFLPSGSGLANNSSPGLEFGGWNTEAGGGGINFSGNYEYQVTGNITLYANWTASMYTVQYNLNSGTGTKPPDNKVAHGTLITLPGTNGSDFSFSRSNYTFDGWAVNGTGTHYNPGYSYTVTENLSFYAMWIPNLTGSVTVTGDKLINATLTADTSGLNATGSFNYQWYRGTTPVGTDSKNYKVVYDDRNGDITVSVTHNEFYGSAKSGTGSFIIQNKTGIYDETDLANVISNRDYILAFDDESLTISGSWYGPSFGEGIFDGNGKTIILNLSYADPGDYTYNFGLFSEINSNGQVKNLRLTGSINITRDSIPSYIFAGALSGRSNGIIYNISSRVSINAKYSAGGSYSVGLGGLVGELTGGRIRNCYSTGSIEATNSSYAAWTGGIAGVQFDGIIEYCWASGYINYEFPSVPPDNPVYAGGILGCPVNSSSSVTNCVALSSVIKGNPYGRISSLVMGIFSANYGQGIESPDDPTDINGGNTTKSIIETPDGAWWNGTIIPSEPNPDWMLYWGGINEDKPWKWDSLYSRPILWHESGVNQQ